MGLCKRQLEENYCNYCTNEIWCEYKVLEGKPKKCYFEDESIKQEVTSAKEGAKLWQIDIVLI